MNVVLDAADGQYLAKPHGPDCSICTQHHESLLCHESLDADTDDSEHIYLSDDSVDTVSRSTISALIDDITYERWPQVLDLVKLDPMLLMETDWSHPQGNLPLHWAVNCAAPIRVLQTLVELAPSALGVRSAIGARPLDLAEMGQYKTSECIDYLRDRTSVEGI
eukprot:COSAG02_NODE_1038_length_15049_cov_895.063144_10_plen_164_part_00